MPEYRLYFLDARGAIQAREEFKASDDSDAIGISEMVCRACSDLCAGFSLWQAGRVVVENRPHEQCAVTAAEIATWHQQIALDIEEGLLRDRWLVSESKKLLVKSQELRDKLNRRGS